MEGLTVAVVVEAIVVVVGALVLAEGSTPVEEMHWTTSSCQVLTSITCQHLKRTSTLSIQQ